MHGFAIPNRLGFSKHVHTDDAESRRKAEGPRIYNEPSKTGARYGTKIDIPVLPPLLARQAEIARRQLNNGWSGRGHIILSDTHGKPYRTENGNTTFSKSFGLVRALAAEIEPSVATLHAQDYRDTAITNLARGGCDLMEIKSFSSHRTVESLMKVIKHYMEIDGEFADRAGKKLMTQMGY